MSSNSLGNYKKTTDAIIPLQGDTITLPAVQVKIDDLEREILSIFLTHPTWMFKAHQIKTILEYKNMEISSIKVSKILENFVVLKLMTKKKGSRTYSYSLVKSNRLDLKNVTTVTKIKEEEL